MADDTIERRIETMERRIIDLERDGATRDELKAELRQISERLNGLGQAVGQVPVLGQKFDELTRAIASQERHLGERIDKLEKADGEFGKKLDELQAQRWKWAGAIAAGGALLLLGINYMRPQVNISQPGSGGGSGAPTMQAAPQGPQVIYYVTRPGDLPPSAPALPLPYSPPPAAHP